MRWTMAFANTLVENTQNSANWDQILPGTRDALERIRGEYAIAVISNADGRIDAVLRRCGIVDCFASITDSGNVGHEKPHPAIFEAALREMKASPAESLYVGDVYSVDYVGARQAGMQAVLFDVAGAYREREFPRVESLRSWKAGLSSLEACANPLRAGPVRWVGMLRLRLSFAFAKLNPRSA